MRTHVWNENSEEMTGASTGKETGIFSRAGGKRIRLRGRRVGRLIWERGWDEVSPGTLWPLSCSLWPYAETVRKSA